MRHQLLDGVAAATTHRDRDDLDRALAGLLAQFIEPHSLALLRLVDGDGAAPRLEERVRVTRDGAPAAAALANSHQDFAAWQERALRGEVVRRGAADGRHLTILPVAGAQNVVGLLQLETARPLSRRTVELLHGILRIVRNHLALLDYGEQDTLTGLLNRKRFDSQFDKLRQRMTDAAQDPADPVAAHESSWLALIDIDHFKSINDGYGHLFGDEVLLLIARLMRNVFRGADQLFRFGGEEFIVILERSNAGGARLALERLRIAIERYRFPQVGRVTASIGYTRITRQDIPTLALARADAALYHVKSHGRNGVRNCEQLQAAGELSEDFRSGSVDLF
ncbi:MAG TPA: GGDEF domain-containing protein [Steroidobacteraceae bacterium]|nr:GGDEF domain-containing protein [Gammaproteobacteria bacterium]HEV2285404.1 GGDEF domain-containing protein [Steroidobacteraceae bacterium]